MFLCFTEEEYHTLKIASTKGPALPKSNMVSHPMPCEPNSDFPEKHVFQLRNENRLLLNTLRKVMFVIEQNKKAKLDDLEAMERGETSKETFARIFPDDGCVK